MLNKNVLANNLCDLIVLSEITCNLRKTIPGHIKFSTRRSHLRIQYGGFAIFYITKGGHKKKKNIYENLNNNHNIKH